MKPSWDKLAAEFEGSKTSGVYDVDCTTDGKDLCEKQGVQGYPTIKYGDPDNLQAYEGEREYEALKKFADENLGPVCGPEQLELCSEEDKALLESFLAMPKAELEAKIASTRQAEEKKMVAYRKKFRKFDGKYKDFKSEEKEEREQLSIQKAEKAKFEKNKAKASKAEIAKQEKKEKKAEERAAQFDKKRKSMEEQKEQFEKDLAAIEEEKRKAGLKFMKLVQKKRAKEEL
mmetsp:Transcript_59243/g.173283  ORF Transcript_59243/g.173283 Transcript_59243/m.173283 type:complete len:231 (+) Transcript_59243:150-842(+)